MSENWEFALNHVSADWLTIIGDDDGLLPNSLNTVNQLINDYKVEAIRAERCQFRWPAVGDTHSGRLAVPIRRGASLRTTNIWRDKVLNARANYTDLPMLYNGGFVSVKCIEKIRRNGLVYRSCIPDVYSAIAVSHVIDHYVFSYEPLAINGSSHHSTGASYFSKSGNTKDSALKFQSEGNIAFHDSMPLVDNRYPESIEALIFESCAQFKDAFPDAKNLSPSDQIGIILATCGSRRVEIESWIKRFCEHHGIDLVKARASAKRKSASIFAVRSGQKLSSLCSVRVDGKTKPLPNVYEASLVAHQILMGAPLCVSQIGKRILHKLFDSLKASTS